MRSYLCQLLHPPSLTLTDSLVERRFDSHRQSESETTPRRQAALRKLGWEDPPSFPSIPVTPSIGKHRRSNTRPVTSANDPEIPMPGSLPSSSERDSISNLQYCAAMQGPPSSTSVTDRETPGPVLYTLGSYWIVSAQSGGGEGISDDTVTGPAGPNPPSSGPPPKSFPTYKTPGSFRSDRITRRTCQQSVSLSTVQPDRSPRSRHSR